MPISSAHFDSLTLVSARSFPGSGALPAGAPDLTFTKNDTDGTTAAYYVFFIVCAIPSVLIQERLVKPKVWIPFQLFMIGVIACGFAAVKHVSASAM